MMWVEVGLRGLNSHSDYENQIINSDRLERLIELVDKPDICAVSLVGSFWYEVNMPYRQLVDLLNNKPAAMEVPSVSLAEFQCQEWQRVTGVAVPGDVHLNQSEAAVLQVQCGLLEQQRGNMQEMIEDLRENNKSLIRGRNDVIDETVDYVKRLKLEIDILKRENVELKEANVELRNDNMREFQAGRNHAKTESDNYARTALAIAIVGLEDIEHGRTDSTQFDSSMFAKGLLEKIRQILNEGEQKQLGEL